MSPEEKTRIVIFLSLIAIVYILAANAAIKIALSKLRKTAAPSGRFKKNLEIISIVLAIVGFCCFGYGYFIEPYQLEVRSISVKSDKIGKPFRIAHISDIHSDAKSRLEEKLPKVIAENNPDVVVFTGDSLNVIEGLPIFKKALTEIAKNSPTYVVKGNIDTWYWSGYDLFGDTGAVELDAYSQKLEVNGNEVWISGNAVGSEAKTDDTLKSIPKEKFSIFLHHYPDEIEKVSKHDIDLYVAGHTHGGQVALPFYGALMTLSKYGKRFEGGTYTVGSTTLNVSRGIGMEGGIAPRVRFWAPPEVTIIDIVPR